MTLNSSPASIAIRMKRGDGLEFDTFVTDTSTGLPIDITGLPFWFTAKRSFYDADVDAQISKDTTGGGMVIIDGPGGQVRTLVDPADTDGLEAPTTLRWDVQWKDSNDVVHTLASGDLIVELDVTRRTT